MTDKHVLNRNLLASDPFAGFIRLRTRSPCFSPWLLSPPPLAETLTTVRQRPGDAWSTCCLAGRLWGTGRHRVEQVSHTVSTYNVHHKSATFLLMYKSIHFISKYKRKKLYCYLYFLFSSPQRIRGSIKTFLSGHLVAHGPVTDFRLPPKVDRGRRMKCISN